MFGLVNSQKKTLREIFLWISGIALEKDFILIDLPNVKNYFYFDFPLKAGDVPRKSKFSPNGESLSFVVRKNNSGIPLDEPWIKIFSSPEIEVWENKTRLENSDIMPLRWGLTQKEKEISLKIARDSLDKFLSDEGRLEQEYFHNLPPRFRLKTDLCVALWFDGETRGSSVAKNKPLGEGIAETAILSARDARFKPLAKEELAETQIEITLMRDLRIPLSEKEIKKNEIYPEKGYVLKYGTKNGWFLPEVFNFKKFKNLEEFLGDLAEQKAGIERNNYKKSEIYIFEIDDFITSNGSPALDLDGPVVKNIANAANREFYLKNMKAAADWLIGLQETDGNIPPVIDPLTGRSSQIDWVRLTFTAWALTAFGKSINEASYIGAGAKSFGFLKKHLHDGHEFSIRYHEAMLAYFGQLSLALGENKEAIASANAILNGLNGTVFDPITFAQIASFFKIISLKNNEFGIPLMEITGVLKNNFQKELKSGATMNLATWSELANTFWGIDNEFACKIFDWLKKYQLPNGAFAAETNSSFAYTRGTGKIFEILALNPKENNEEINKALFWLAAMQYTGENTFFIPPKNRHLIMGGLRHDYFNPETWIDAAGHFLLGASRLISANKSLLTQI